MIYKARRRENVTFEDGENVPMTYDMIKSITVVRDVKNEKMTLKVLVESYRNKQSMLENIPPKSQLNIQVMQNVDDYDDELKGALDVVQNFLVNQLMLLPTDGNGEQVWGNSEVIDE